MLGKLNDSSSIFLNRGLIMPIFISYSHNDKVFVDKLANQLVQHNVNVWLDRWELSVGDSIIDCVQNAVEGASALLVVLSNNSVNSEWCKKELSAGLLRELEEKRVVVMPLKLDDCSIPLFARGKMYADFTKNFDEGLKAVLQGIAKITNPSLGRAREEQYDTDWSIDDGTIDGNIALNINFAQLPKRYPYTCLSQIEILANTHASARFIKEQTLKNNHHAKLHIINILNKRLKENGDLKLLLSDEKMVSQRFVLNGSEDDEVYYVTVSSRRMGEDTGFDVLVNVSGVVDDCYQHMSKVLASPYNK